MKLASSTVQTVALPNRGPEAGCFRFHKLHCLVCKAGRFYGGRGNHFPFAHLPPHIAVNISRLPSHVTVAHRMNGLYRRRSKPSTRSQVSFSVQNYAYADSLAPVLCIFVSTMHTTKAFIGRLKWSPMEQWVTCGRHAYCACGRCVVCGGRRGVDACELAPHWPSATIRICQNG